uniref:Uncharacterized protein n=1 Tax=Megaselia scalaris TaxID=36166 RepID=T1GTW3_MEGSC
MCQQYQHKFNKATISGPIEVKPTHLATRQIYKEEDPTIFEGERQFQTPPHKSLTPVLPEITRGITFLPESDDDDLGLGVLQSDEQITPPQSVFKKIKTEPMEMAKKPIQEVKPPLQPPLTVMTQAVIAT